MHICAHQITSWAVFHRAAPVASQSPSLTVPLSRRDLIVKSYARVLKKIFFFHLCHMTLYQNDSKHHLHKGLYVKCPPCPLTAVKYVQKLHFFHFFFKKEIKLQDIQGKKVVGIN